MIATARHCLPGSTEGIVANFGLDGGGRNSPGREVVQLAGDFMAHALLGARQLAGQGLQLTPLPQQPSLHLGALLDGVVRFAGRLRAAERGYGRGGPEGPPWRCYEKGDFT